MKKVIFLFLGTILLFLAACTTVDKLIKPKSGYYYQSDNDQKDTTLVIPPDLTTPDFVADPVNQAVVTEISKKRVFIEPLGIRVKRSGNHRYLVVDKNIDVLWDLTQDFLRNSGFSIEKSEAKIGALHTNYLRRQVDIPQKELNFIRAYLKKSLKANYVKPVLDKYIVRLETSSASQTEIYFSIQTIEEVSTKFSDTESENTEWQLRARDSDQEAIMLYRLMAYLGTEDAQEITTLVQKKQNLQNPQGTQTLKISSELKDDGQFVSLKVALNKEEAWRYVGWALDSLSINVEDKDKQEGSFYVKLDKKISGKSIFSKLFAKIEDKQIFQILVQQLDHTHSDISLNVLSKDEQSNLEFSRIFLGKIAEQLVK